MRKKGIKAGVPRNIINTFCDVLHNTSSPNSTPLVQPVYSPEVQEALEQQMRIGNEMMTRGFLARGWMTTLVESGCPNPERQMNTLQTMVWEEFAFPMWSQCNEILHKSKQTDSYHREEDNRLAAKITWYQQHKHELLLHHDQWLAKQDLTRLHRMRRETKREWVRILDKARQAYDNELNQVASSQNV